MTCSRVSARYVATDVSPDEAPDGPRREWPSMEAWLADPDHYWYPEPEVCTVGEDILKRLRDALETAAGEYGSVTDEQRNEWLGLVKEVDDARWFVRREGAPTEEPQDTGDSAA